MYRILRLLFCGYWHDKPKHVCDRETIEILAKKTHHWGSSTTSKVYVLQCNGCGTISQTEVR